MFSQNIYNELYQETTFMAYLSNAVESGIYSLLMQQPNADPLEIMETIRQMAMECVSGKRTKDLFEILNIIYPDNKFPETYFREGHKFFNIEGKTTCTEC